MSVSGSNGKIKVKAVVLDYGNVISMPQAPNAAPDMARLCGLPMDTFRERYWHSRLAYDRADLNGEAFWKYVVGKEGTALSPALLQELYRVDSEGWGNPNPIMLGWAEQLRAAGLKVAVLSNMPHEISVYLAAHRRWVHQFDPLVFSCDLKSVKPEEFIYRDCLRQLQLAPEEVLFLDDKHVNVEGAQRLGIHSLVFETAEDTLPRVREQFDLPSPEDVLSVSQ